MIFLQEDAFAHLECREKAHDVDWQQLWCEALLFPHPNIIHILRTALFAIEIIVFAVYKTIKALRDLSVINNV